MLTFSQSQEIIANRELRELYHSNARTENLLNHETFGEEEVIRKLIIVPTLADDNTTLNHNHET